MLVLLPTQFVCINCGQPSIMRKIQATETVEIIGIEVCSCKGDPSKIPVKRSNVSSFLFEKEKRQKRKK